MRNQTTDLDRLEVLNEKFKEIWSDAEPHFFRAPGRVNLIGEHTDYNEGFVLPIALNYQTIIAAAARRDDQIKVRSLQYETSESVDPNEPPRRLTGEWINFVEGVARILSEEGYKIGGANLLIDSNVPLGAGLSSSAALEISTGMALTALGEIFIEPLKLALVGQRAEHEFVGTKSGIMDQFVSVFGRAGKALLIDCRRLEAEEIALELGDAEFIVCNSSVKHELVESAYNTRRAECEKGVELLREFLPAIKALRDVSESDFEKFSANLPDPIRRRCRHIVTENARTIRAARAFQHGDLAAAGKLMSESHASMRDDFEISCTEVDTLVNLAENFAGVYGSRLTGGGFGGCTINLVKSDRSDEFIEHIRSEYLRLVNRQADIFRVRASEGATEIKNIAKSSTIIR